VVTAYRRPVHLRQPWYLLHRRDHRHRDTRCGRRLAPLLGRPRRRGPRLSPDSVPRCGTGGAADAPGAPGTASPVRRPAPQRH